MKKNDCSGIVIDLDEVYVKYKSILDKLFSLYDVPEGDLICDFAIEEAKLSEKANITAYIPMLVASVVKDKHRHKLKAKLEEDTLNIKYKKKMDITLTADTKKSKKQLKLIHKFLKKLKG